jgi:phage replication O-like protein O
MAKRASNLNFHGFTSPRYTQVPDELFDEVMAHLSGAELKVLLYVIRRTFGFKKDSDTISLAQICKGIKTKEGEVLDHGTGLSLSTVQTAIKGLLEKYCVVSKRNRSKEKGDEPTTFSLNLLPYTESRQGGIPEIGNTRNSITTNSYTKSKFEWQTVG